jgi:hypothetical protein
MILPTVDYILRHRLEDGIKMDLRQIGWEGVDWFRLAQDRDQWQVNMVMNFQALVPWSLFVRLHSERLFWQIHISPLAITNQQPCQS